MRPRLILASKSPRRRDILSALGYNFEVAVAKVEECQTAEIPEELPLLNAQLKAEEVAKRYPNCLVLGADTAIVFNGECIGKPADVADAKKMLRSFSGKTHLVVTGVVLRCENEKFAVSWIERSEVTFKEIDDDTIERYLGAVSVFDKAGAYAIQEHGEMIISGYSGEMENIIGLPISRLKEELEKFYEKCR